MSALFVRKPSKWDEVKEIIKKYPAYNHKESSQHKTLIDKLAAYPLSDDTKENDFLDKEMQKYFGMPRNWGEFSNYWYTEIPTDVWKQILPIEIELGDKDYLSAYYSNSIMCMYKTCVYGYNKYEESSQHKELIDKLAEYLMLNDDEQNNLIENDILQYFNGGDKRKWHDARLQLLKVIRGAYRECKEKGIKKRTDLEACLLFFMYLHMYHQDPYYCNYNKADHKYKNLVKYCRTMNEDTDQISEYFYKIAYMDIYSKKIAHIRAPESPAVSEALMALVRSKSQPTPSSSPPEVPLDPIPPKPSKN